ncbi:phage tail protein [Lysinibacillus telephonicus]|uniref:phage tail protein n=1 Tax=Lysinibacillus telephonicus TaxID=1714840 RepID=UPI003BA2E558
MSIRVIVDDAKLREVQERLGEFANKAPNAIANSLNRTMQNVATNITKGVRERYHVKAASVKENLKKTKATRSNLTAEVRARGTALPLDRFKVSPKTVQPNRKKQLKIAVKKDGTKEIMGAFIANISGIKVFKRDGDKRLPISRLFGPSVPQMAGNEEIVDNVYKKGVVTFETRLNHEVNRILNAGG